MSDNKIPKILVIGDEGSHKIMALTKLAEQGEIDLCFYKLEEDDKVQGVEYDLVVFDPLDDLITTPHDVPVTKPKIIKEPKHKKPFYNKNRW